MNSKRDKEQLKRFYSDKENSNTESLTYKQRWINKLKKQNFQETTEEKKLYKKFCELANTDPDKKFKFRHIEELNTGADVVIVYGKKGIGKTRQISEIIRKLAEEDEKGEVILIRNTVSEFQVLEKQLDVNYWPIYLKGKTNNNPTLYHKYQERNGKPRYMGFCAALNGFSLESAKGAEYPNIRLIIWDECTNTGAGNKYDRGDIARFVTFLDSIIRNKKNVKIYIFGNFHRNTDGKVSDILLDLFNIPYGCKLKIIESKSGDNQSISKLLYINTGNLYSGVDSNAKIGLFGTQIEEDLLSNIPKSECEKVGGLDIFYKHTPQWGLLFNDGDKTYILLMSKFAEKWMIHMEEFPTPNRFVHPIFTQDANLFNQYNNFNVNIITEKEFRLYVHDIYEISLSLKLFYSGDNSRLLITNIMTKWQNKYNLGINICFFKEKRTKIQGF